MLRATVTKKLFLVLALTLFLLCFSLSGGIWAQEAMQGVAQDEASRQKAAIESMEQLLKAFERRLQILEGQAGTITGSDGRVGEETSPSAATSLEAMQKRLEFFEKRLQALETPVQPPPSDGPESLAKTPSPQEKEGFHIYSGQDKELDLRLGGALQVDYRYYSEEERADNRFDIRRARLYLTGSLYRLLAYRFEYEFQGTESQELLDAYGEISLYGEHKLRFGQFKEPFSLEWLTKDNDLYFAERSMGYYLSPVRDVGLMVRGPFLSDTIHYSLGFFNGDGTDGSTRGNQNDDLEVAGRIVVAPFKALDYPWLSSFQIGGSATQARIDLANVDLEVKSTGMVGTTRNLYVLNSNTKFGVLNDAGTRQRMALEAAWAWGPLALQGEYVDFAYTELQPATGGELDAEFSSWYASGLLFLTGEEPALKEGIWEPLVPIRDFNPSQGDWGAFAIGARLEHFSGDPDWITPGAYVSVREADAFSLSVNWMLNPLFRFIADYTYTEFPDKIRVRTNSDGTLDYVDEENVFTLRSQFTF